MDVEDMMHAGKSNILKSVAALAFLAIAGWPKRKAVMKTSMLAKEIGDLRPGEYGYAVPWAMYGIKPTGQLWLRRTATLSKSLGGTVSIRVERTENGDVVVNLRCMTIPFTWNESEFKNWPRNGDIPVNKLVL